MNQTKLKISALCLILCIAAGSLFYPSSTPRSAQVQKASIIVPEKGCVFQTLFGETPSDSYFVYSIPENVNNAMDKSLQWMAEAQLPNGGWGAGSHSAQGITDPHAVPADPATTATVSMALMRAGNNFYAGKYSSNLKKALDWLLNEVEVSDQNSVTITTLTNTQIQSKLGQNIDVVLTAQYLGNALEELHNDKNLYERVKKNLETCVAKIQRSQAGNGSIAGAGWAGVLQTSLANNALETAQSKGVKVDQKVLDNSRTYLKDNHNPATNSTKTDAGAGVILYTVSGSARASAKEARKAEESIAKAKDEGKLEEMDEVNVTNLEKTGMSKEEAIKVSTSYKVYNSAKVQAQADNVMTGYGNNGGEEFLSFLQTGESLIINKDESWKKWYENISGKMLAIQNPNGSWQGHHCITSPVFCTATSILILSISNDLDELMAIGK